MIATIHCVSYAGTLLKSNSFNVLNFKPKVKLVDEVVPPKQKGAKEHTSFDTKERPTRMISKSISFKSVNSSRPNASDSKVKMLSSKFPNVLDIKGKSIEKMIECSDKWEENSKELRADEVVWKEKYDELLKKYSKENQEGG